MNSKSTNTPLLTIVIPCFNAEVYLASCIESIFATPHPEVEIILVDDGSTDSTPTLCDAFSQKLSNVTVIHKANGGSSSARNAGLRVTKGKWVWFVDADDLIAPGGIDCLLTACKDSKADAIQIGLIQFEDGTDPQWKELSDLMLVHYAAGKYLNELVVGRRQHYAWSFLFHNKEQWNKKDQAHCLFDEKLSLFEDVVSIEQFVQSSSAVDVLDVPIYGYRQVSSSITHRRSDKAAKSGLNAVKRLEGIPVPSDLKKQRLQFEISMLFVAYGLVENHESSRNIRKAISSLISEKAAEIGFLALGASHAFRYAMMRTGLLKVFYDFKYRGTYA